MLRKLHWIDRIGVITAWVAMFLILLAWVFGRTSLFVLLLATGVIFMFTIILVLNVLRNDDDPNNDTVSAAAGEIATEAKAQATSGWLTVKGLFVKSDTPPAPPTNG